MFPERILSLTMLDLGDLGLDSLLEVCRHVGSLAVLGHLPLQSRQSLASDSKHVEHDLVVRMGARSILCVYLPNRAGTWRYAPRWFRERALSNPVRTRHGSAPSAADRPARTACR